MGLGNVGLWLIDWSVYFVLLFFKIFLWAAGALLFGLWWCQNSLLYIPNPDKTVFKDRQIKYNPEGYQSPLTWGLPFEDLYLTTSDRVRIHAWLMLQPNSTACPTIIFAHGNAGNIGLRLPQARNYYDTCKVNFLLLEYRGYGNSEGSPSEHGLQRDAQAALDHLLSRPDINPHKIVAFGTSLGAAVATALALNNPKKVRALLVENTFRSIDDIALMLAQNVTGFQAPWLFRPLIYVLNCSHWNTLKRIQQVTCPILFLSGQRDELIHPEHMQALFDAAVSASDRSFYPVENGSHNDTWQKGGPPYYDAIREWVWTHCEGEVVDNTEDVGDSMKGRCTRDIASWFGGKKKG